MGDGGRNRNKEAGKKVGSAFEARATSPIDAGQDGNKLWALGMEWLARVVGKQLSCVRLHEVGGSCESRGVRVPLQLQTGSHAAGDFS